MKYYVFLTLTVLFWSGNFIFGRLVASSIEPIELAFYRWFFVLVVFLPYLIKNFKKIYNLTKENFIFLFSLSILGITAFNTLVYYGLQTTTAINALLINSITPIIIIILSSFILKVFITKIQFLGIVLSTFGVFYLILKGNIQSLFHLHFTNGDFWILFATFVWALYSILLKFKPKEISGFDFLSITTFIGTIFLSFVFFGSGYSFNVNFVSNKEVLYSLIYIVVFPSIISFYLWNLSVPEVGANKAGQFAHLMPLFGSFLAYIFLKESLEFYHLVGIIFIALGIYYSIFYKKKNL